MPDKKYNPSIIEGGIDTIVELMKGMKNKSTKNKAVDKSLDVDKLNNIAVSLPHLKYLDSLNLEDNEKEYIHSMFKYYNATRVKKLNVDKYGGKLTPEEIETLNQIDLMNMGR